MRSVNLSRRPFVNRRPILRLAILLWLVGAALLFLNLRLFSGHFRGTGQYQERLSAIEEEVREADARLRELDPALARIDLARENGRTQFLNSLISYRKFPWSALFDDLERVVPLDVRLVSVKPAVRLAAEPQQPQRRRRSTARRTTSRRSTAPGARTADATEEASSPTTRATERRGEDDGEPALRRNEVVLSLAGVARTEEALLEFVDTLYANPSFREPFLPGETLQQGASNFSMTVIYLTRPAYDPEDGELEDGAPGSGAPASGAPASGEAEDGETPGVVAELRPEETRESADPEAGESAAVTAAELQSVASAPASRRLPARERSTGRATPGRAAPGRAAARQDETEEARAEEAERRSRAAERAGESEDPSLPGAAAGAAAGEDLPGADPSSAQPGFAVPAASATPALRRGSLLGLPGQPTAQEALA